jgi:cytochrome c peroxidase
MHDGSLSSLEEVLDHYAQGGHKNPRQDSRIRPFILSAAERVELLAFLASLSDRQFVENPEFSPNNGLTP